MDGGATANFRGRAHIDSDVLTLGRTSRGLTLPDSAGLSVRLGPRSDSRIRTQYPRKSDLLKLASAQQVGMLVEWGGEHVRRMDEAGKLQPLDAVRLA